jgi:hypothetical protein
MNRWIVATGTLVAAGLFGGGVVAARLLSERPEARAHAAEAVDAPAAAADTSNLELRIRQLEERAAPSPAQGAASSTAAPEARETAPSASVAPSPEESTRRWLDQMAARKSQVAAEPEDRSWSREATAAFRKDFDALSARGKFKVSDVECKTTSCLAKLSWGSYADATKSWHGVLLARYTKNCAKQVFVPPPEPGQAGSAYEGTVFFDCTEDRAQ